jgi:hypothetical protein
LAAPLPVPLLGELTHILGKLFTHFFREFEKFRNPIVRAIVIFLGPFDIFATRHWEILSFIFCYFFWLMTRPA